MENEFEHVSVGDTVGVQSGTGKVKKIYRLVPVQRLTKTRIVADRRQFYKDTGREVGGISRLVVLSAKEIADWNRAKAKEEAEAEERRRNYDPRQHDDHVQAALRSLRDKARTLCEILQTLGESRRSLDERVIAPVYWNELVDLIQEIETSENALASVGLSTALKTSAELRSLFQ